MSEQTQSSTRGPSGTTRPSGPGRTSQRSGPPRGRTSRGGSRRGYRGRYQRRKKVCAFCLEKTKAIDYKDLATLRRYVTERGKIKNRRKTGTCAKHQRRLAIAIKRARHLALMPFTAEQIRRY
jgi:small subunit ribosomal protein S18